MKIRVLGSSLELIDLANLCEALVTCLDCEVQEMITSVLRWVCVFQVPSVELAGLAPAVPDVAEGPWLLLPPPFHRGFGAQARVFWL